MSFKDGFNAKSVRDYSRKAVVVLLTGVAFTAGSGFATEAQAQNPISVFVETFQQNFQQNMNAGSARQQSRQMPDVERAQKQYQNAPWKSDPAYQLEIANLRLQASTSLKTYDISWTNAKAACLTAVTNGNLYTQQMPHKSGSERAQRVAYQNQVLTTFGTCNETADNARETGYNYWASYFLQVESRYAQAHGARVQQSQQQQTQQAQQQQQADGQVDAQKQAMCRQAETAAFQAAVTAGSGDGKLPASHPCVTQGYVRR